MRPDPALAHPTDPPGGTKPWLPAVARALASLALLLLIPCALRTLSAWPAQREFPYQLDAEEGFILNQAVTLARGGAIYTDLRHPPFLVGNYPPLFPWLLGRLTGPRATLESMPRGRLAVHGAALLTALLLAAIAAWRTRRALPALLAPLLFFSAWEVAHWSAFVRVDFPALLLTIAGLGVFLTVRPRWGAALAAVLFVAAGYTRQTALVAPAACALALLISDRRRLAWFLVPYAALGLVILAVLEARTGGQFLRHVVTYNQNRMDWTGFARVMKNEVWFFYRGWILALLWGGVGLWMINRKMRNAECGMRNEENLQLENSAFRIPHSAFNPPHARHAPALYLLLAALSLASYAKVGAAPNYVLEPLAAAALWSAEALGLFLGRLSFSAPFTHPGALSRRRRVWLAAGALGFCFLLAAHGAQMNLRQLEFRANHYPWGAAPQAADRAAGYELLKTLRAAPGDVFCEDPVYTLLAGKPVLFQPFIISQLAREGKWDQRPVLDWLRARRFSVFAATADLTPGGAQDYERYTPAMAEALKQNYTYATVLPLPGAARQYYLWEPKK